MSDIAMRRAFDESRYNHMPPFAPSFRAVAQGSAAQTQQVAPQKPARRAHAFEMPAPRPRRPDDPMLFLWGMSNYGSGDE